MNKSLFCRVGDVQCKQFHFFCSDFKHQLLRIICNVKKTQKKIHFSLYPQPPPPDTPRIRIRIRIRMKIFTRIRIRKKKMRIRNPATVSIIIQRIRLRQRRKKKGERVREDIFSLRRFLFLVGGSNTRENVSLSWTAR